MIEGESPTGGSRRRVARLVVRAGLLSLEKQGDGDRFELFHVSVDAARIALQKVSGWMAERE
jgi:hypothetical protein